jgi:hypothetical protein
VRQLRDAAERSRVDGERVHAEVAEANRTAGLREASLA